MAESFCSCPLSPAVSKASAGAMELMPVYSVSHLENFLKAAKSSGWHILGTAAGSDPGQQEEGGEGGDTRSVMKRNAMPSVDCHDYIKQGPTLLVLGMLGTVGTLNKGHLEPAISLERLSSNMY